MKKFSRHLKNERGCLSDGTILAFGLIGVPLYLGVKAVIYGIFVWVFSKKILKNPLTQEQSFGLGFVRAITGVVFYLPLIPLVKVSQHSNVFLHGAINLISAAPAWVLVCFLISRKCKPSNKWGYLLFVLLGCSLSFVINHFILAMFPGFR